MDKKGFSLIEVIIASSILLIIVISFAALLSTSFAGIFGAGKNSRALFQAQQEIETVIVKGLAPGIDTLRVTFPSTTVTVSGSVYEGSSGKLRVFLPN
jgi:prepilin-type N-terminal cleavage/methylation domain-containing protein